MLNHYEFLTKGNKSDTKNNTIHLAQITHLVLGKVLANLETHLISNFTHLMSYLTIWKPMIQTFCFDHELMLHPKFCSIVI